MSQGPAVGDVCLVAPPFLDGSGTPITVPPRGYGGIQWSMAHLIDGLAEAGVACTLLGAPGSDRLPRSVAVDEARDAPGIVRWIEARRPTVVADFANFSGLDLLIPPEVAYTTTWQLTGRPAGGRNPIYVSRAQRRAAGDERSPVIRLPANPARFHWSDGHDDYLLFLGRVSPWKGAYEAAALAAAARTTLVIAGPAWEPDYQRAIVETFGAHVTFVGEVHGGERDRLLSRARALVALSQSVAGPWSAPWCEPGSAVVAEAAMSGTPVIGSDNGCLAEIVPDVGVVVPGGDPTTIDCAGVLDALPSPAAVRRRAIRLWGHRQIAGEYLDLFDRVVRGAGWGPGPAPE